MRIFYLVSGAVLVAIAVMLIMNFVNNPVEARRVALATDIHALKGSWEQPELNRGTPPERHEETIAERPEVWQHIVERPKPKPQPFDIQAALRGVEPTRQALGERIQIRVPGNPRGAWFQVGDQINGVTIVEITREQVNFEITHADGKTYTHSLGR